MMIQFKKYRLLAAALVVLCAFVSCSKRGESSSGAAVDGARSVGSGAAVSFADLKKSGSMSLRYATQFSVDYYELPDGSASGSASGGAGASGSAAAYKLVRVANDGSFLIVPENAPVPSDIPLGIKPLMQPLDHVYVVATAAMDVINVTGSLGNILFSGTKAKDWSIPEVTAAMEAGKILYAGKYSAPDYELLTAGGCDLAIENTMVYHKPEVKEKLEELGFPVLVEYSSYEPHPLGRLEWIKLYGVLFGCEDAAAGYYADQISRIEPIMAKEPSGLSVAFFYVNNNGAVNVRKPNDYVVKMITLSGGKYALEDVLVEEDNALSTMNMMMEDFYVSCVNSDILIYNGTIDTEFSSLDDLFAKSGLFRDFAAVKSGKVYFVSKDFYQQTTGLADFMEDLYKVLNGEEDNLTYLVKL